MVRSLSEESVPELQVKIMRLLNKYPHLVGRIGEPGWAAEFCLQYYKEYHGLRYKINRWLFKHAPSPETLLRVMRMMRISPRTKNGAIWRGLQKSGPIDSYTETESG
jgi:hypothetical protein